MKVRFLRIANFRGFESVELKPRGHVILAGEPGAGRSDVVEALWRVLSPASTRFPLTEDLDFFNRDLTKRIEVEIVLGELGPALEQAFFDRLELWDREERKIVEDLAPGSDREALENVVRLCYRAAWLPDQQQARQWVDFPKFSDPDGEDFRVVPRDLREELPVAFVRSKDVPLSLGVRGELRRLVDAEGQLDFSVALDELMKGVEELAEGLVQSKDLARVLKRVLDPLRIPVGLGDRSANDIVRFTPEGGSLAGVLRALQPALKLRESLGYLPLDRHGSTLSALMQLSQAVAHASSTDAIVVVDDFGENIDVDAAQHLAGILRVQAAQAWLSTRRGVIGRFFRSEELIRLTSSDSGVRRVHTGSAPVTKAERLASRHFHLQILPAISSKSVVIVEGPHDRLVLTVAAIKQSTEDGSFLPAAQRRAILDAGAAEGSGGVAAIPRLAMLARNLGFHVTAIIDWDRGAEEAKQRLRQNLAAAHVVIRWPEGCAVEKALLSDIEDEVIQATLKDLAIALSLSLGFDPDALSGKDLADRAVKFLKSSGGLHAAFLEALPEGCIPPLITKCLNEIRQVSRRTGLVQL